MDDQERIMPDAGSNNIEIILVRMEGKIDRQTDRLGRFEEDVSSIRGRLHDLANQVAPVIMLGLPDRFRVLDQCKAEHDARITALENVEERRKGAAALVKVLWAIMGALGVGGTAAVLNFVQHIQH